MYAYLDAFVQFVGGQMKPGEANLGEIWFSHILFHTRQNAVRILDLAGCRATHQRGAAKFYHDVMD